MAQGSLTVFKRFIRDVGTKKHDLANDTFKIALLNNKTVPTADAADPVLGNFKEVSGGGYAAGGATMATTYRESDGTGIFDATGLGGPAASWTQNESGPTNIFYAVIYNDTSPSKECVCFVDMTADGGKTPISLQAGNITWGPGSSGILAIGAV